MIAAALFQNLHKCNTGLLITSINSMALRLSACCREVPACVHVSIVVVIANHRGHILIYLFMLQAFLESKQPTALE